ncbi:MAG: hypothetical protein SH819_13455 [Cytophagales bacterium]|nr:hypothetical protein [Cytophagales bacterium]
MRAVLFIAALLGPASILAQLKFPDRLEWQQAEEGKNLSFAVGLPDGSGPARFSLEGGEETGMALDSTGHFSWTPSYDLVDRITRQKEISVIFQAIFSDGKIREPINFIVHHVNRPPVIREMPTFYVRMGISNSYQITSDYAMDPDGGPLLFTARLAQMPEGASFSSLGQLTWTPSRNQFNNLKGNPLLLEISVQDQPDKAETTGRIRIAQTQLDLPPDLLVVPGDSLWIIKENEVVNLKIYVSDPNGDDNIDQVDFIGSDPRIPRVALKENSKAQSEFTWRPGYDFVEEAEKKREVLITFFAFDKSNNRVQRKIRVRVMDTENVEEKDMVLYQKYVSTMSTSKNLIDLLDENYKQLDVIYQRARKGKKKRTILNASLGAVTGLSPLVLETNPSKTVSVVGGTSVLTLNSLEAGQVIGRNVNEFQNKIKTNRDLRNQLQLKGNYFARKYALRLNRRGLEFEPDRDDLSRLINSDAVASLALPALARTNPSGKEVKKTFVDFSEE